MVERISLPTVVHILWGSADSLTIIFNVHRLAILAHLYVKQFACSNQITEFLIAIVDRRKRAVVGDITSNSAHKRPAIVFRCLLCRCPQQFDQSGILPQLVLGSLVRLYGSILFFFLLRSKVLGVNKQGAGINKWLGRFLFAESINQKAALKNPQHQWCKVAVACHQGKGIYRLAME